MKNLKSDLKQVRDALTAFYSAARDNDAPTGCEKQALDAIATLDRLIAEEVDEKTGKIKISKEWCMKMASLENGCDISAGKLLEPDFLKMMITAYCKDQFENQSDNHGCCNESMKAAFEAIRPYLCSPDKASGEMEKRTLRDEFLERPDIVELWEGFKTDNGQFGEGA